MTPDISTLITQLGLAGFAMFILWKMAIMFVQREKEKDISHQKERDDWAKRLDSRDVAMRTLEADIRNTFSASLTENSNVMKQALTFMARKAVKK